MEEVTGNRTETADKRTRPKARAFWKSPAGRELRARYKAEYSGKPQPKNLGRTGPRRNERGDSPAVPTWQIARALTSGHSERETAAEFKMKTTTVTARAHSVRLQHGTVFFCDQGLPFRDKTLTALRTASGFQTAAKFERFTSLPPRSADRRSSPDMIRTPEVAKRATVWRDKAIRVLVEVTADKNRSYKNQEVIRTFLPDLASLRDALAETFAGIQAELRQRPEWQIADVWNFVCDRVQEGAPDAWHRTLCYLWEIESILASKLSELRDTDYGKDKKGLAGFVCEILAARYGTTYWTIIRAMRKGRKGTRPISPGKMLGLLHESASSATAALPKPTAAPTVKIKKRGVAKDTPRRLQFMAAWYFLERSTYGLAQKMYPGSEQKNAEAAVKSLRDYHPEEVKKLKDQMDRQKAIAIIEAGL